IQLAMQQKTTAAAMTGLEKAKRLPELSLGYFNTSMQGTGADDLYYSSSKRFSAAQIGVGIPIFQHAQKVKAEALQVNEVIAGNNLEQGKNELSSAYRQAHLQYLNNLQIVESYESSTLEDAKLIRVTADHQFERGEIGFLEWIMLISQVITVRTQYLDACASLNESIIALNYLTVNQ
ncbi:MAG TPA: TolC family protein, partial [Saprospiraceae bacterium]|nr:TolC family protein [Saprospiraceae bacterium]